MKYSINLVLIGLSIFLYSCGGGTTTQDQSAKTNNITENEANAVSDKGEVAANEENIPESSDIVVNLPESHDCTVAGEVFEGNQQWFRAKNTLVAITADQSTFDEALGESHRLLVAYDTKDCSEKFKEALPISVSADYPYYLTPIDSINSELIGVLGADRFFVYDVENNRLSNTLNPKFRSNRQLDDAQSGAIIGLETWGRYVIGYMADKGAFVYNLTIPQTPKQETAFAEYKQEDGSFSALFLLNAGENMQQAILPEYDLNNRRFTLNPLLEEAGTISEQINKSALDNRYIVLRMKDEKRTAIAIDMEKNERIKLPESMQGKATQEIVEWMKKQ